MINNVTFAPAARWPAGGNSMDLALDATPPWTWGFDAADRQQPQDVTYAGWAKWANVGIVKTCRTSTPIVGAQAPYDPNNPTQNWNRSLPASGLVQMVPRAWPQYESNGDSGGGGRNWVLIGDDRLFFLFCATRRATAGAAATATASATSSASSRATTTPRSGCR